MSSSTRDLASEPAAPSDPIGGGAESDPVERTETADGEVFVGAGVPAVVAVIPTRDPDEWFDELLEGLATQDYANLATLVVDAGSYEDVTPRVAARMGSAFVRRIGRDSSFSSAANEALHSIEGAVFYLFLHDDVQLAPDSVQGMVTEAFRSNAGVVGAKLVDWSSYDRLQSVGAAVDKFGFRAPLADAGELDQAQHDTIADVFMVSTAAMLVRADLFDDLRGFATDIPGFGEDLDLCWRARVAGARVIVMPGAVARHAERSKIDEGAGDVHRLALRHQARIMLACYSTLSLLRVVPQAALYSIVDAIACLLTGRLRGAWDVVTAWGWNLRHLPRTLGLRRQVARVRRVRDADVRAHQVRGSARLSQFLRDARSSSERRIPAALAAARDLPQAWQEGSAGMGLVLAVALIVVWVIGSRSLLSGGVPAVREFSPFGPVADLVRGWWAGWSPAGFGASTPSASLVPLVGLANLVTFGSSGFVRTMLVLGALPIGALGAWRMLRGAVSPTTRVVTTIAYAIVPLPYDALAAGRLQALAVYAAAPFLIGRFMRSSGVAPFAKDTRSPSRHGLILAVTVSLAGAVAPVVLVITLGMGLVVGAVLALGGQGRAAWRTITATIVGIGLALLVLLPDVVAIATGHDPIGTLLGSRGAPPSGIEIQNLLRLSTGVTKGGVVLAAVSFVALGVLFVGRQWRLRWGIVGWALAIVSWAIIVVLGRSSGSGPVPSLELLLTPAAVGLTLAVGLGAESFRRDVLGGQFGWRQLVAVVAALAFVVGVVPLFIAMFDGSWGMPGSDSPTAAATLSARRVPEDRTLWLGDPDDLPMRSRGLVPGVGWALTDGSTPTLVTGTTVGDGAAEHQLETTLRDALRQGVGRLGSALAPYGIRYIVVQESEDPGSGANPTAAVARIEDVLSEQLDLNGVDAATGLDVFRSMPPTPVRSTVPSASAKPPASATPSTAPGSAAPIAALRTGDVPTEFDGHLPAGGFAASYNRDGQWHLGVAGRTIDVAAKGAPFQRYTVEQAGAATFDYRGSFGHLLLLVVQFFAFCAVIASARRARLRRPEVDDEEVTFRRETPVGREDDW
jgi:GT2 family glycosyltransferase